VEKNADIAGDKANELGKDIKEGAEDAADKTNEWAKDAKKET
jgi:hypothetical protein